MHPTLRVASARVHTPLIHFIGKRSWPSAPEPPHPHPAGPPDYKAHFADFAKKFKSSSYTVVQPRSLLEDRDDAGEHSVYQEFWQAPTRLWNPRVRSLSEAEVEAVVSGGASYR